MSKICPQGHRYDPQIYGDQCPLCAQQGMPQGPRQQAPMKTNIHPGGMPPQGGGMQGQPFDGHTHVVGAAGGFPPAGPNRPAAPQQQRAEGETRMRPNNMEPKGQGGGSHTVIRRPAAAGAQGAVQGGRRLVGFLVSFNRYPMGRSFNIYEGRNTIGRDSKCDISIPDDQMMSGTHLSILYRGADNKFKFRDEQSSNGTFVNKELIDEGELQNYDVIRAGSTVFTFIAIPQ